MILLQWGKHRIQHHERRHSSGQLEGLPLRDSPLRDSPEREIGTVDLDLGAAENLANGDSGS